MDNCNFTLNRAKWKVMKISFNTTENKCAWEQLLIEYCCHSFGSIRPLCFFVFTWMLYWLAKIDDIITNIAYARF